MIRTIGIIGGTGQMGKMFTRSFEALGKRVLVSDAETMSFERELVENSDLVIVCVPMDQNRRVVRRIAPWLNENQLLSDYSSVKSEIIPEMLDTKARVISSHPMFGPLPDISRQNIILLPVRPGSFLNAYSEVYRGMGLNVVTIDNWKDHDELMSFIQGLMHFFHIVFTQTMKEKNIDLSTLLSICSPVYQANFAFSCRILQRDPHLYTHILMDNPENVAVLNAFIEQAKQSVELIKTRDEKNFIRLFLENRDFLGNYGKLFSEQSDYLVDKLKEYPE